MSLFAPPDRFRPADFPVIAVDDYGTFCRPGCAEIPDADCGQSSYRSPKAALEWGYNPCPSCRPMDAADSAAERALFDEFAVNPVFSVKAQGLLDRGIEPDGMRRRFRDRFALSFQDFLRMRRINNRFGPVRLTRDSGGREADGRADSQHLVLSRLFTVLGPMIAAASEKGIAMLEFAERRMLETQVRRLEKRFHAVMIPGVSPLFEILQKELDAYFSGKHKDFSVPLDLRGSFFQQKVWAELQRIPYGATRSYGDQARAVGDIKAVRAVAAANGDNPVAIIVPCHRVIGGDGSPVGYGGRIWRKEFLLDLESPQGRLFS